MAEFKIEGREFGAELFDEQLPKIGLDLVMARAFGQDCEESRL
jgi:hypothetical protein